MTVFTAEEHTDSTLQRWQKMSNLLGSRNLDWSNFGGRTATKLLLPLVESDTTLSKMYWGKDGAHDILFQSLHSDCKVECLPTPCSAKIWNACDYPQSCSSVRNSKQVFKYNPETATVGLDTLFLAARGTKHSVRIRPGLVVHYPFSHLANVTHGGNCLLREFAACSFTGKHHHICAI